jgi:hypothetical protein
MWAAVAATVVSAASAAQAGKDAQAQANMDAKNEEEMAKDRSLQYLQQLNDAQASANSYYSGRGVRAFQGTPVTVKKTSYKNFLLESGADLASSERRAGQYRIAGKAAKRQGYMKAASSLLSGAAKYKKAG